MTVRRKELLPFIGFTTSAPLVVHTIPGFYDNSIASLDEYFHVATLHVKSLNYYLNSPLGILSLNLFWNNLVAVCE